MIKKAQNHEDVMKYLIKAQDVFIKPKNTLSYDDLCKAADYLLACSVMPSSHLETFYNFLVQKDKERKKEEYYSILEGSDALISFTLLNWFFRDSNELNRKNLELISNLIHRDYLPAQGEKITKAQINNMMALVNEKYDFNQILRDKPIKILLVESSYTSGNSLYAANKHQAIEDLIIMTCISDYKTRPEYTFLHELGHLLHTRISHKIFDPPKAFDKFIPFIRKLNPSVPAKPSRRWLCEVFADFFATAVLLNSPYTEYDTDTILSDDEKMEIESFFDALIRTLPHNKKGNHSWDFLYKKYAQLDFWGEDPYEDY